MKQWRTKSGYTITRVVAGRSNVFLITGGSTTILVDTSLRSAWKKLDGRLKGMGIGTLDGLVLTHAHYDHAENAHLLQRLYGAQVFVHSNEVFYLATGNNTVPHGTNKPVDLLVRMFAKAFLRLKRYNPCACDVEVDDGLDLSDYGFNARILHTPGHSPGSMSVIVDDEIALVGDCLFGVFPWSVLPPFAGDTAQMIRSWGRLLDTKCRLFLPAHGREKTRKQVQAGYDMRRQGS
jgi:hydroxyacylglutathione hydrolase